VKDIVYWESESVSDKFPKHRMNILLRDLNAKAVWEHIIGDTIVTFATSKYLTVICTVFPHLNIHKYILTSPDLNMKNCCYSMSSKPALGSTQQPIQWAPVALSLGVKRPRREADHSPPTTAEIMKTWSYKPTSPYAFMA
jgi:hypothetical protein